MFSTAKSIWGSATNALTNVATFADSVVKDLADDPAEHERVRVEDVEEYRKLLNELEMQQVELSKQSRLALAQKQAELETYKRKLREFLPDENALDQLGVALGEGDILRLQAERDALQQTSIQLQEQLQVFMNEVTGAKVQARKLEELEKRFAWTKTELSARVAELEASLRVKDLELENLVDEYSKLAANAEEMRAEELARVTTLTTENEVLATKVQALEQALSNVADKTSATKHIVNSSSTTENVKEFQSEILHLKELLTKKDAEIEKISNVYNRACDELKTFMEKQPEVSSTSANVEGLKQEIINVTEMLKVSQEQLKVSEADFAKRIAAAKIEREAEVARLQVQSELDVAAITEGFTVEIKRLETELSAVSSRLSDAVGTNDAVHAMQMAEIKAAFENAMLCCKKEADETWLATLDAQRIEADKRLEVALAELSEKKNSEIRLALAEFTTSAQKSLDEAVAAEVLRGRTDVEDMRQSLQSLLVAAEAARDTATANLANVEERWVKLRDEAVRAIVVSKDAEREVALSEQRAEAKALVDKANAEKLEFLELYTKENKARKIIHNKLLELQGNIRVICRVRPILEVERRSGEDVDVTSFPSDEDLVIQRDTMTKARYEFDRVFAPVSIQTQVFDAVQPLCVSVLDGFNVCIFAYGQTGSGKTYTMEGYGGDKGVSPRAIDEIFRILKSLEDDWTYTVHFSMLEIYNETIRDLLVTPAKKGAFEMEDTNKLDVRQTPEGNVVPGLTEVLVTDAVVVQELMAKANSNRAVGSHDMNEHSSRSHSILTLVCRGKSKRDGSSTYGKLNLIDLAGSERIGKTDATGDRLKEAQNINRSLSALGDVINALGNKKSTHVPYRNSKLTFLLQDSLGGQSKCLMFVNISPAVYNLGETICSLNFASRCRNTELGQAKKQTEERQSGGGGTTLSSSLKASGSSSDILSTATTPASAVRKVGSFATSSLKK